MLRAAGLMYASVHAAVAAMLRYQERQRAPRSAPWPDHAPPGASGADPWRYVYVHAPRNAGKTTLHEDLNALSVLIIFHRYDRRRALTRLYIEHQTLEDFRGRERRRARCARARFVRELCHRLLLQSPRKGCLSYANGQCPARQCGSKAG